MSISLLQSLQDATGLGEAKILRLIARSPYSYKVYTIPKKSGGVRTIAQPARESKYLQRWLIDNVFTELPLHEAASAYKVDASIKKNAAAHKNNPYIAKFDFQNFFPSIKEADLVKHFSKHLGDKFSLVDLRRMARLCCFGVNGSRERCLSIGAPSSPLLSNSVMYEFDFMIDSWCRENNLIYTRYADDLTFSTKTKGVTSQIESKITQLMGEFDYPRLSLNNKKTVHLSKKYQRRITGLIVNNEGELSIGRERKREISALIHRYILKILPTDEVFRLQGLLGFAKDVEPTFMDSMRRKYGWVVIDSIFQVRKPDR